MAQGGEIRKFPDRRRELRLPRTGRMRFVAANDNRPPARRSALQVAALLVTALALIGVGMFA